MLRAPGQPASPILESGAEHDRDLVPRARAAPPGPSVPAERQRVTAPLSIVSVRTTVESMVNSLRFRIPAGVLIAVALVHVGTLIPRVVDLAANVPLAAAWIVGGYALSALTALTACVLAAFLLWKASDRPAARMLILFLTFLAIFWGSLFRFVELTNDGDSLSVGLTYGSNWISQSALAAFVLCVMSFVRFTALFPRPLTADRLPPARLGWLRRIRETTLRAVPVWGAAVVIWTVIRVVPELIGRSLDPDAMAAGGAMVLVRANLLLMLIGYVVVPLAAAVVGIMNLRTSYRLADAGERRRMTWVMVGFSAATWLILAAAGVGVVAGAFDIPERVALAIPVLFGLAPLLVVLGSVVGVLYGGAIDPALALQRSTVYGVLAALAVVAFAGLENGLSALIEQRLGLPGFTGSVVAGAIVALALIPVRRPLKRFVTSRLGKAEARSAAPATSDR